MRQVLLALLLVAIWPVSVALAAPRTWTDAQGKTLLGDYVRVHNGEVVIQRPTKAVVKVPYWNLSEADREYVKEQLEAKGQMSLIPPEPVRNTNPGEAAPGVPGGIGATPGPRPGIPGFPGPGVPGIPSTPPFPGPGFPGPGPSSIPGAAPGLPGTTPYVPPGDPGSSTFPGPSTTITPPRFEAPSFTFELRCPKCNHTWRSGKPDVFAICPSCGHNPSSIRPDTSMSTGSVFPAAPSTPPTSTYTPPTSTFTPPTYSPPTYSDPSTNASYEAGKQAGAAFAVILMIACPLIIAVIFILAVVAIIFFVVKAVSSPAPVPTVRRNY